MTVKQTGSGFLLAITIAMASASLAQEEPIVEVAVPDDIDPNAGSGWIHVELAVLVDDRPEVLASEAWPAYPETRYPLRHRRLTDDRQVDALMLRFPETQIIASEEGLITLLVPDPGKVLAEAAEAALAPEPETMRPEESEEDLDGADDNLDVSRPRDEVDNAPIQAPPALEMIDAPSDKVAVGADWLADFTEPLQPGEALVESPERPPGSTDDVPTESELPDPEPALPRAFSVRPTDLLDEGLSRLTAASPDKLQLSAAWLQPPDAANLPIIFDNSGDIDDWPPLQGFIELRTGETLKIGVNFWWNTDAAYLPLGFHMDGPPPAPPQLLWRDKDLSTPLATEEVTYRQATLKAIVDHQQAGLPIVEFVDPSTGFFQESAPPQREETGLPPEDPWPWQHFLHVTDTRTVPEGYIRYFDHPVLKIITTWRELTWGEVYQIGAADQEQADIDAALEAAGQQASGPGELSPSAEMEQRR